MSTVEITPDDAAVLRALINDSYLFTQMSRSQQQALTAIVDSLPILEDGVYLYVGASQGRRYSLYFVKDGKHSTDWFNLDSAPAVPTRYLNNWTRLGDLPA